MYKPIGLEWRTGSFEEQIPIVTRPRVNLHKSPSVKFVAEVELGHQFLEAEWGTAF